jgi:NAD(P)-dependent dehydrogenase (short-subunit alcohol dehydrogenase family)
MRHEGKSVLVTGGANGIGRGIVERFIADGANVMIADIDEELGLSVAEELGERARFVRTDVTDEASADAAVTATVEAFGSLDVSVNNAGIIVVSPMVETTLEQWNRIVQINLTGVFLTARASARQMIAQGRGGAIINASSGAGRKGTPFFAAYSATKAGIIMMSQSMSLELAPERIRVNCYAPGHTMTPLWDQIAAGFAEKTGKTRDETIDGFVADVPWGRFGTPKDVAAAVSWLASDDSEYVVGQTIGINGGELPWD